MLSTRPDDVARVLADSLSRRVPPDCLVVLVVDHDSARSALYRAVLRALSGLGVRGVMSTLGPVPLFLRRTTRVHGLDHAWDTKWTPSDRPGRIPPRSPGGVVSLVVTDHRDAISAAVLCRELDEGAEPDWVRPDGRFVLFGEYLVDRTSRPGRVRLVPLASQSSAVAA